MSTKTDRCPGTGQRTLRPWLGPDQCPVCLRKAYVCVDGTTGSHRMTVAAQQRYGRADAIAAKESTA